MLVVRTKRRKVVTTDAGRTSWIKFWQLERALRWRIQWTECGVGSNGVTDILRHGAQ